MGRVPDLSRRRAALVEHLRREGIRDERVLAAIGAAPRERFVPPELAEDARRRLEDLGIRNALVVVGDGTEGFADHAPYDGILVTAATPRLPAPLVEQCARGGRIVAPIGGRDLQQLTVFVREDGLAPRPIETVKFVPLIGHYGFHENG